MKYNLNNKTMKTTGVWIDKKKAAIITIENGVETTDEVFSKLEKLNVKSETGNRLKGGIQSSTYLKNEHEKLKKYYREIARRIKNTEALVILGPGETATHFSKELHTYFSELGNRIKGVHKADSMTENQLKAWVKNFFETN